MNRLTVNESVLRCAQLCHNSYMPYHIATKSSYMVHKTRIHQSNKDVLVDVWKSGPKSLIVSFRGSVSVKNLITYCNNDMRRFTFRDKDMYVHGGVLDLFESIHDEMMMHVGVTSHRMNFVTYTGYSLGGALATLSSLYFALMFPLQTVNCYTFGTPLVGDKGFVSVYEDVVKSSLHVVNKLDVVPLLIPVPMSTSFFKRIYRPMPKNRITYLDSKYTTMEFGKMMKNPLHHHEINTYIENIENILQCNR